MKEHKTLFQQKREIEEDINFINEKLDELEKKYNYVGLQVETNTTYHYLLGQAGVLKNQLQMIDDIIEMISTIDKRLYFTDKERLAVENVKMDLIGE